MAIQVEGYGNITQSNAKEIYTAWKRGEVDLNKAQQTKCESFLTPDDMDEVQYDEKTSEKRGKDSIDAKGAEEHDGQGGNAAGTSIGAAATAAGAVVIAKNAVKWSNKDGWVACAFGAAMLACSALCAMFVKMFDNGYKDRTAARDASDQSNQTMDTYAENLAGTMEMMNEDVETYNEQQDVLTRTVNTQVSQGADLQMQIDAANAMGDTKKAQSLKEQLKAVKEQDNSALEEDLEETGGAIEEYRAMNAESAGCAESGQSVSDFLKEGTALGVVATLNTVLLTAASIFAGTAIATSIFGAGKSASRFDFGGLAAGIVGSTLFAVSTALLAKASYSMGDKAKNEFECASAGGDMQDHVNSLNEMIEQQSLYADDTQGQFAESDEAASESKSDASEKAGEAVSGHKDGLGNKPKEEKPEGTGAAA